MRTIARPPQPASAPMARKIVRGNVEAPPHRSIVRTITRPVTKTAKVLEQANVGYNIKSLEELQAQAAILAKVSAYRLHLEKLEKDIKSDVKRRMDAQGIVSGSYGAVINGEEFTVDLALITKQFSKVDPRVIKKHVTEEEFMNMVSITQEAANQYVSGQVLNKATTVGDGAPYVMATTKKPISIQIDI